MKKKPAPPALASGLPVHCHFDELLDAAALKPFPGNWKKHPAAQLDRYEKIVRGNGWRRPVVVSLLSGCITRGHGAWQMAARSALQIPVEYQHYATRAEEIRDLVADNKLAELAQDDDAALARLLSELDSADLELAAVNDAEMRALLEAVEEQTLTEVQVQPPPKMAWVLVGIPLVRFAEINAHIEAIAALPETVCEIAANDQEPADEPE